MSTQQTGRVDWVDTAKGICILMVVMMHSTLGVEMAAGKEGWLHTAIAFAKPFRMPDFFLISGLFLARVIDRDWRTYIDRKVLHFFYFYVLWVTIQFAFKAPAVAAEATDGWLEVARHYAFSFIEPFGTLWFIYMLPVFFVVTKLARRVSPWMILAVAAALEIAPIHTGWMMIDEFAGRFVYFYIGYLLAPRIFELAQGVQAQPVAAFVGLLLWAFINGAVVFAGYGDTPFVSLGLGLIGAGAVVATAALVARLPLFGWLRYCGENSIVIYLAFFLPMAATRMALLKTGIITDIGLISLIVTVAGVVGALAWYWAVRGTPLRFLFRRPDALKIERKAKAEPAPAAVLLPPPEPSPGPAMQPAE